VKDGAFLCLNASFHKVTLVKVCTLVQKVVTLASGKRMLFRVHDDLPIFLKRFTFKILFITLALRILTAEIAIKCFTLLKVVSFINYVANSLLKGENVGKGIVY
jgi:hypothetical protein